MEKLVFESEEPITLSSEDCGCALLVDDGNPMQINCEDEDNGMFVVIGSWDDNGYEYELKAHPTIKQLIGKKVRVTLEVID